MKKFICIGCLLVMGALVGCSADVTETYILTTEYEGVRMEEKIVLQGKDDDTLEKSIEYVTLTFDSSDVALVEKEAYKESLETYVPDTKYITMDWSETESTITLTETTDFKQATSDKAAVYRGEIYLSNQYYSMEETAKDYVSDGFTLVVDK